MKFITMILAVTLIPLSSALASVDHPGKEIYEETCEVCHGEDGTGELPGMPNFKEKDGALSKSDDVLLMHIIKGYRSSSSSPMPMPPRGGNPALSDDDIKECLAFVRKEFGIKR